MSSLANALFTKTQRNILMLLYGTPTQSRYLKQILSITAMGVATIKRELDSMVAAEILIKFYIGNQTHFKANSDCIIYKELLAITHKTLGVADKIASALLSVQSNINWAFIYGSEASGKSIANSDIDIMIIGTVSFSKIIKLLYDLQLSLGREINPKVYQPMEWRTLQHQSESLIAQVLKKPTINIIGDGHEFKQSGGQDT